MTVRGVTITLCVLLALSGGSVPVRAEVEIEARVNRSQLSVGESTSLDVVVRGAAGGVGRPEFEVPSGLEVLGTSRAQSISWINGRSTTETTFRFELGPNRAGTFRLGPIRVRVGEETYQSARLTLTVTAAPERVGGSTGGGPASLTVDLDPANPYVGQPVRLRVRLIQRESLAEDPRYAPPSTPGFWSEEASRPESYYADERNQRVLVTETRTRMYPIDDGVTEIGEAVAHLALTVPGAGRDPLQWLRGRVPRRDHVARSKPLRVNVRPLPDAAPAEFDGAVGDLEVTWRADRRETRADVPISIQLDLRGVANLPLLQAPDLVSDDFEIFASTVDDSFPQAGSMGAGRRRFIWTALPRREGRLTLRTPRIAWFEPRSARYQRSPEYDIEIDVGPPLIAADAGRAAFPLVFVRHPVRPGGRPAVPWGWAVSGLALGTALVLWRRSRARPPDAADRAMQREWLRVVGLARGTDFWRAAEDAALWLESRGRSLRHLRREVAAARYGGSAGNAESVRRRLIERLSESMPPAAPRWQAQAGAAAALLTAIVLGMVFAPWPGDAAMELRARSADEKAREGDLAAAQGEWESLWREGGRPAGLAARLAWAEVRKGAIPQAVVWILRGEGGDARNPALGWVRERVREAGGLTGADGVRLPVRRVEWAALALAAAMAGCAAWPRRRPALGLLAAAALVSVGPPLEGALRERVTRGVVASAARLEGPELELEPGHVVQVLERNGERTRVAAGRGVEGWLPAADVIGLEES